MASQNDGDILVRFTTQFSDIRIPPAAISVPAALNRAGLTQVISHILGKPIEERGLEFFVAASQAREIDARRRAAAAEASGADASASDDAPIQRALLRTTLKKYARDLGLSGGEDVLSLEYAPAVAPPTPGPRGQAPEWVGAIAASESSSVVAVGLYDGSIVLLPASAVGGSSSSSSSSGGAAGDAATDLTALLGGGGGSSAVYAHGGAVVGLAMFGREGASSSLSSGSAGAAGAFASVVSSGADGVVRLWRAESAGAGAGAGAAAKGSKKSKDAAAAALSRLTAVATLESSGEPCGSVAIDPLGSHAAGGDGSGSLYVWSLAAGGGSGAGAGSGGGGRGGGGGAEDEEEDGEDEEGGAGAGAGAGGRAAARHQKRKRQGEAGSGSGSGSGAGAGAVGGLASRAARLHLREAHEEGSLVSSVAWLGSSTLASGGWDHTVSVVDVEAGGAGVVTLRPGKVVTSLAASGQGGVLASGHPDGIVRVWDPRGRGRGGEDAAFALSAVGGLRGTLTVPPPPSPAALAAGAGAGAGGGGAAAAGPAHMQHPGSVGTHGSAWVSSLAWCPTSAHILAGASYTGATLLWDVRAPGAPLHVLPSFHGGGVRAAAGAPDGGGAAAGKALSVAWMPPAAEAGPDGMGVTLLSGGSDRRLLSARVSLPRSSG